MLYVLLGLVLLALIGFAYEQNARRQERNLPTPGRLVDVGGYRLHLVDEGQGGPTVVIIPGAGDCSYAWMPIQHTLARFTRVISYDRPGLGSSDDGPAPGPEQSVTELHTLLERANVGGPVVLVGHSLGGLIARLYAQRYPEQVAGLVFVDSTHEFLISDQKFKQGFAAIGMVLRLLRATSGVGLPRFLGQVFGLMPLYPELAHYKPQLTPDEYRRFTAVTYRNVVRSGGVQEFGAVDSFLAHANQVMRNDQFGDMPVVVLTNPGFGQGWIDMHRELAGRSTRGIHQISDQKGHSLQMPRPDMVVSAVRHVLGLGSL